MQFRILGPLQVVEGGRPVDPGPPRQQALLALLLIHANKIVSTDRILEELWPTGPPAGGSKTLQVHVSKLRKTLAAGGAKGQGPLRTEGSGYCIEVGPEDLDALLFERLWRRARDDLDVDPGRAAIQLHRALGLWRGSALEDFAYEPFAASESHRLNLLRLSALEDSFDVDLALARHAEIVDRLETLVHEHPLRERLRGQLMVALYRLGQQTEALEVFSNLRHLLGEELGIEPSPQLADLEERILLHDTSLYPPPMPNPGSHELPARLTSFVGRWREQAALHSLLRKHRIVTISGVGGVGKTSLAIEAARDIGAEAPDGVWLVRLAALDEGDPVVNEVASVLGRGAQPPEDPETLVIGRLRNRRCLMILDNCEHVIGPVAELADSLLRHCPELHILATSRVPLNVEGEAVFSLSPLEVPPFSAELATLESSPSVRLLVDRTRTRYPAFALDGTNAASLADICRQVAGIPLAIELAAARLSTISPTDLAERMGHQLDLLTAGTRTADRRQQTLEAALDWSYRLLSDREQAVLRRAAVFRGSFTLAAAEAVLAGRSVDSEHVADLLGRLADASMITMGHQQANRRYGMLEPIRQYGLKLLAKTGETAETRQAHVRYFAERSAELTEQFEAQKWSQLLTTGEPIIDDCRDSLSWAIDAGDSHRALGLAASIGSYWTVAGATREGLSVLANALETTPVVPSSERLRTLEHCAHFAIGVGEPADRWLDELEKVVAQGATEYSARAAGARGLLAYARGDLNQAMGLFANAYHASLEAEHEPVRTGTLLAECLTRVGRLDEADALLDELDRGEAQQDEYGNHYIAVARGMVAFCRGSLEVAEAHLETAVKAFGIQGSAAGQMESMMYLGWVALDLGKVRRTRLLVENSLALARKYAGALYEATSLWLLARLALQQGDTDGARVTLEVCTDVAVRRREAVSVAFALFVWADLAYLRNHPPRAAQLFGAAERALHGLPHIMPPTIGRGYAEATADLRDKMGTARFEHLTGVGHEMTRDDAIAYATSG